VSFPINTNVLSEMTRPEPNGKVVSWLADQPEETLFLSVIALGEISEGVLQLPSGTRRKGLLNCIREEFQEPGGVAHAGGIPPAAPRRFTTTTPPMP